MKKSNYHFSLHHFIIDFLKYVKEEDNKEIVILKGELKRKYRQGRRKRIKTKLKEVYKSRMDKMKIVCYQLILTIGLNG